MSISDRRREIYVYRIDAEKLRTLIPKEKLDEFIDDMKTAATRDEALTAIEKVKRFFEPVVQEIFEEQYGKNQ